MNDESDEHYSSFYVFSVPRATVGPSFVFRLTWYTVLLN